MAALVATMITAGLLVAAGGDDAQAVDPVAALTDGNRLFRDGLIEEAVEAYQRGYDSAAPHPTLLYNLGTALHHLDRLPEAILWYRRGESSDDPWLEENLWLARRTLGSTILPPSGPASLIARAGTGLRFTGALAAWLGLGLLLSGHGRSRILIASIFAVAVSLYLAAVLGGRFGPRPAVLIEDCATLAGDLPAGTEVWVKRQESGDWRITARSEDAVCPASALIPLDPRAF